MGPNGGFISRRAMLAQCGMGMGSIALASLLGGATQAGESHFQTPLAPKKPHFPARAKRIIHLFMNGGPSHLDTFDPKPKLTEFGGKELPVPNLPTERKTG